MVTLVAFFSTMIKSNSSTVNDVVGKTKKMLKERCGRSGYKHENDIFIIIKI